MPKSERGTRLPVFILSGSTGRTGRELLNVALAQFDDPQVDLLVREEVRSIEEIKRVIEEAAATGGVICHSILEPALREVLIQETTNHQVPTVDVLGPVVTLLDDHLDQSPRWQAGLFYELRKEQLDRIDAVDFTLSHDDGCGLAHLDAADVVLVGVSRVSKSVTCFYLSYQGIRAANVPIVPGQPPLPQLLEIDPHKVIGLTMYASRLESVRLVRAETIGLPMSDPYLQRRAITAELREANEIMEKHGWRCIDVSYMSVEEVAKQVIAMLG